MFHRLKIWSVAWECRSWHKGRRFDSAAEIASSSDRGMLRSEYDTCIVLLLLITELVKLSESIILKLFGA